MPETLTAIAAKAIEAFPAAAGAVASMKFLPVSLTKGERLSAAVIAYFIGTYLGRGITAYLNITNPRVVDAIVFGVALFGLSFVGAVLSEMKPAVQALRYKYLGKDEPAKDEQGVK